MDFGGVVVSGLYAHHFVFVQVVFFEGGGGGR